MHQNSADRDSTFRKAQRCFRNRRRQKCVHRAIVTDPAGRRTLVSAVPKRTARVSLQEEAEVLVMLHMALVFLVIGLIAAVLGFTTIAGASIAIAKFLAGLFLVLFLVFLIIGMMAGRKVVG